MQTSGQAVTSFLNLVDAHRDWKQLPRFIARMQLLPADWPSYRLTGRLHNRAAKTGHVLH
jgi:predicted nucleic acid-binding protein